MTLLGLPLLSLTVFLPLVGVVLLFIVDRKATELSKWITFGTSFVTFLVSLALLWGFDSQAVGFQFVEKHPWIPAWGVDYHVGIDGITLFLVLLTTLLTWVAVLGPWHAVAKHVRE